MVELWTVPTHIKETRNRAKSRNPRFEIKEELRKGKREVLGKREGE